MSSAVAVLRANLVAETGQFVSGLNKATKPVQTFTANAARMAGKVMAIGGAVTALVGGGSLAMLTRQAMQEVDALGKMSDSLGITTEALSAYHFAAEQSGASGATINKALQRMNEEIGKAREGTGQAKRGLDMMGVSLDSLAGKTPDQQFRAIAQAISEIDDPTRRAAAAQQVFGRQSRELMNLLMSGEEGLDAFAAEAEKLGLTVAREGAAKIEMANDAMNRMKSLGKGVGRTLAVELAPFITAAADKFTDMATEGMTASDLIVGGIEMVTKGVAWLADGWDLAVAGFHSLQSSFSGGIANIMRGMDAWQKGYAAIVNMIPGVKVQTTEFFGMFADELDYAAENAASKANAAYQRFEEGARQQQVTEFFADIRDRADEAAAEIAKNGEAMNANAGAADELAREMEKAEQNAAKVEDTLAGLRALGLWLLTITSHVRPILKSSRTSPHGSRAHSAIHSTSSRCVMVASSSPSVRPSVRASISRKRRPWSSLTFPRHRPGRAGRCRCGR